MHFFIDHAQLTNQASSGDGFGPSAADPTNKYDVSANFQLAADAKAFACQPGHIIVTDFFDVGAGALDPALVNVILKPTSGLTVNFPTVKYYIYRGVKRDSFFTGGNFNPEDPGNTDTVRRMWEDWHANAATNPDPLAPSDLGFDASLAGTTKIEEIFGGALVTLAGATIRARQVTEGEWIGNFGSIRPICFEVIVEAQLLNLDLDYARKSKVQIDISNMTSIPSPTPAQIHALRCEKEKILAYVDPAALFGMHFSVGVSGIGLAAQKGDNLATTFLSRFSTATRVYLDIRSDKGYSYNFYDNYGGGGASPNLIKIKPGAAAAFVDDVYLNQGWPLFSHSGWTGSGAKVNLGLHLRIDDNIKPLLFVEDTGHLPRGSKNFLDQTKLLDGAAVDWSKAINLKLDGSGSGATRSCVATHLRLQYVKQNTNAVVNPRLLQLNNYLDTVFGGIDLPIVGPLSAFGKLCNEKVGLAEGGGFAHIPETGMYFDSEVVLFYGSSKASYRVSSDSYPIIRYSISQSNYVVGSKVFPSDKVLFSGWQITEGGVEIKLIDLYAFNSGAKDTSIDGIHFLGLTRAELTRLQATAGFGPVHQRFLVFEEAADHMDDNGLPYKKYEVRVQGLDADGQRIVVAPSMPLHVFGTGANTFCSAAFSASVIVPTLLPDPGLMHPWEHVYEGRYSERGDADVTAVTPSGRVMVDDLGNDNRLSHPWVQLRAQYFFPTSSRTATGIGPSEGPYPLVVIVHGNGHLYTDYARLGKFLAQNGFIVASIDLTMISVALLVRKGTSDVYWTISDKLIYYEYDNSTGIIQSKLTFTTPLSPLPWTHGTDFEIELDPAGNPERLVFLRRVPADANGMAPCGRSQVIFEHLRVLKLKFKDKVMNNIGLVGHSRGGEAVVRAARVIGVSSAPGGSDPLRTINAVISLAPTDQYEKESLVEEIPYFVLYGSMDRDVDGGRCKYPYSLRVLAPNAVPVLRGSGGFSLYDRARNNTVKSMSFMYGASHNGFITSNKDTKGTKLKPVKKGKQRAATRAYMNAFLRQHLLGERVWESYFTGGFIPRSIGHDEIYQQYNDMTPGNSYMIDDFENKPHDWRRSSSLPSFDSVSQSGAAAGLVEGELYQYAFPLLDEYSPHETGGLRIADWTEDDSLTFTVSTAGMDVRAWTHFSFKITQAVNERNSYRTIESMKVAIVDASGARYPVLLSRKVPDPDYRGFDKDIANTYLANLDVTKSAFVTIRILLTEYQSHVDLSRVTSVEILFPGTGGDVEVDDLEFTR